MKTFRQFFQRIFLLVIFCALTLATAGCDDEENDESSVPELPVRQYDAASFTDDYNANDTWVIQWYLCGTDLETGNGFASTDLKEIMNVKLPANIKFLIETGGAQQWQNDVVDSNAIERYLYDSNGLQRLETLEDADMGDVNTLTDFISYGQQFPADHRIFIFWDHGGGSVGGICLDERTQNVLSLNDLTQAFGAIYEKSTDNPPFEIIGFDACLMATYDTINSLDGFARYVIASEEVEPGVGWNYTGWLGALANNPAMGGAKLGKEICDSYIAACKEQEVSETATLSVVDMKKLPELRDAYETYGLEALVKAYKDPKKFFSKFGRGADNAESYGSNNWFMGYTNMVDITDLARLNKSLLTTTDKLIGAIDGAVVYKVYGEYRSKSGGISSFHSYDSDEESLAEYLNLNGAPDPQKLLYYYLISGDLPEEVKPTLKELADDPNAFATATPAPAPVVENVPVTPPAQVQNIFNVNSLEDFPVDVDSDGNAFIQLTQEHMDLLSAIRCQLVYISVEDDLILYLGSDSDIIGDWDTGLFKDNFRAVWPMLDGHPVYVEITAENDGYNLYSIPIKLNGVECSLQVAYVYASEEYFILGARRGLDNAGMSSRDLIKLRAGDEITTIHYGMTISGNDEDFTAVEVDTFTIGEHPQVKDEELGDGTYAYCFEFISPKEDSATSQLVTFTVEDGNITTSVDK